MSNIFLIVGSIIAVAIAIILILAAMKPDVFRIQRSITIAAQAEKIFPQLNDFQRWPTWSPYEHKDPNMKRSFSGPASGPGAIYAWDGDKNVGQGRIEITEMAPNQRLAFNLVMLKPFEAQNKGEFTLAPQGNATVVTWTMHGPTPYLAKIMHVFFNMDRMVGGDFEAALANLKAVAER
jgi:uncharacterized protein YndB with AHSA1/START domain